ncbi:MAG: Family ership [Pseudomonadota bacterium]|jgi:RIO kinase 1
MRTPDSLTALVDHGIIDEVVRPLMSGKEAEVFLVVSGGEQRVAKIYKEAQNRSFQNRADYTEGRKVRNSRDQRAMGRGSKHGKAQNEAAWRSAEVDMIYRLRDAGVRVPHPYHFIDGVLIMELVVDGEGFPAPRLGDLVWEAADAAALFKQLLTEVVRMLSIGVVHGDLSDFNVLMSAGGPVVIDFPQSVDAATNANARKLLIRDVENLHRFASKFDPTHSPLPYAEEMWELYKRNALTPETQLSGRFKSAHKAGNTTAVLDLISDANRDERKRREARGMSMRGTSVESGAGDEQGAVTRGPTREHESRRAPPGREPRDLARNDVPVREEGRGLAAERPDRNARPATRPEAQVRPGARNFDERPARPAPRNFDEHPPGQARHERPAQPERESRAARPERESPAAQPERESRAARPERESRARPERESPAARPERESPAAQPERESRAARPERESRARPERESPAAQPERESRDARPERESRDARPERESRDARPERDARALRPERDSRALPEREARALPERELRWHADDRDPRAPAPQRDTRAASSGRDERPAATRSFDRARDERPRQGQRPTEGFDRRAPDGQPHARQDASRAGERRPSASFGERVPHRRPDERGAPQVTSRPARTSQPQLEDQGSDSDRPRRR